MKLREESAGGLTNDLAREILASPTGADSNPLVFWLRAMDALRRDFCEAA